MEFFKGKQFAKDENKTTWYKWLIWQWEIASGVERSLTLSEQGEGGLGFCSISDQEPFCPCRG